MSGKSDWRKFLEDLRTAAHDQGWREVETDAGHRLLPPHRDKPAVTVHKTPSDHRAQANTISQFRRSGGTWPWPPKGGAK